METKPFVMSVLLAATAFLSGCSQQASDCVDGKRPDGTPCSQSGSQSTGTVVRTSTFIRPSELSKNSNAVASENGEHVGGFGDAHAGVAGKGGVGG